MCGCVAVLVVWCGVVREWEWSVRQLMLLLVGTITTAAALCVHVLYSPIASLSVVG